MKNAIKIVIAVAILYFVGVGVFSIMTYPNTYVSGQDKSFTRIDDAYNRDYSNRKMTINGRNNKKVELTANQFSYTETIKPNEIFKQNQFLWPIAVFQRHEYNPEYDYTYSEQQLDDFLSSSELMQNTVLPEDAKLQYINGKYEIVASSPGDTLDKNAALKKIVDSFLAEESQITLEDEYMKPEIKEDDPNLKKKMEDVNKIISMKIVYDFGKDKETLEGERLLDFYKYTGESYEPIQEQVHEYLRQLAIEYDTFGEDVERKFNTTGKGEITVKGGIYGWQMDVEESTAELMKVLSDYLSKEMVPVFLNEGLQRGKDDLGNTYIEIDLSRQHLWYYKDGQLMTETDIVTGDPNRGVPTPTGVFKVWSREKDRSLVGIVPQSSADYSSYVDFWMPITWTGVGIHNSRWRSEFGGSIYNGNGSYGCINLPFDPTKIIFDNIEINTPVVIY
ncbi:MAG: L,D-transpeptidase family protein [Tissierellia bacterium]|nr:L,D-transpeptidase family protein [Tissierellia bacterium]